MSTLSILAAVGVVTSATSISSYWLWHNNYNIWLLDGIGKLVSYIVFPGESDLYEVARAHAPGRSHNFTHREPCILCSKTQTVSAPLAADAVWDPPPPNPPGSCHESARKGAISKWNLDPDFYERQYNIYNCEQTRPTNSGGVSYNFDLTKDCVTVNGFGGMPSRVGVAPSQYIKERLFPAAKSITTIKPTDYNVELFTVRSPYVSVGNTDQSVTTANSITYTIIFRGFYKPVNDITSSRSKRSFIPPCILNTYSAWMKWPGQDNEYFNLDQMLIWADIPKNTSIHYKFEPTPPSQDSGLWYYLREMGFTSYQLIRYNGRKYYSLEYSVDYEEDKEYTGEPFHPTFTPLSKWSEESCKKYINIFMQPKSYSYQAVRAGVSMKKRVARDGFWRVQIKCF